MQLLNNISIILSIIVSCITIGASLRLIILWYRKSHSSNLTPVFPQPVGVRSASPQPIISSSSPTYPFLTQQYMQVLPERRIVASVGAVIGFILEIVGSRLFLLPSMYDEVFFDYFRDLSIGVGIIFLGFLVFVGTLFLTTNTPTRRAITVLEALTGFIVAASGIVFYTEVDLSSKARTLLGVSFLIFAQVSAQLSPSLSQQQVNSSSGKAVTAIGRVIAIVGSIIGVGLALYVMLDQFPRIGSYPEYSLAYLAAGLFAELFGGAIFVGMLFLLTSNAPRRRKVVCLEATIGFLAITYGLLYRVIPNWLLILVGAAIFVITLFLTKNTSENRKKVVFLVEVVTLFLIAIFRIFVI